MYKAKVNGDIGVKGCKVIGDNIPLGYEKTEDFFVDNSGLGCEVENALTFDNFLTKVKAGYYYAITGQGQFQVYISEFKRISKPRKQIYADLGILSSKKVANNTRLTEYIDGTKILKLHETEIIKWVKGYSLDNEKIVLSSGGWKTVTTKRRINEYINRFNTTNYHIYQKNGNWYIKDGDRVLEFFDGIEL